MAVALAPIFKKAYYSLAAGVAIYLLFVLSLAFPAVQRFALYAHRINPTWWQDLSNVEAFGFLPQQIQSFTIQTADNETLHAWHILPLHLVDEYSDELEKEREVATYSNHLRSSDQVLDTLASNILASDPNAHVVVNFHGNAAHLASAHRPLVYQRLLGLSSKERPVHVIGFDYRGFGLSSGYPTEEGLIKDGEAVMRFLTGMSTDSSATSARSLRLSPQKIILTSQSLGTAVSAALLHRWTRKNELACPKGIVLMSAFSSLSSLIDSYSINGIVPPLLSPFRSFKPIMNKILSWIVDTWSTDVRLADILNISSGPMHDGPGAPQRLENGSGIEQNLTVEIIHAKDDLEIPWLEAFRLWRQVTTVGANADTEMAQKGEEVDTTSTSHDQHDQTSFLAKGEAGRRHIPQQQSRSFSSQRLKIFARFTLIPHGGHNRLAFSESAAAVVWRILQT